MATRGVESIEVPDALPVLPLRDSVLYPNLAVPILVALPSSVELVTDALSANCLAALVAQRSEHAAAGPQDLYEMGTLAILHELGRTEEALRLAAQGVARIRVLDFVQQKPYLVARISPAAEPNEVGLEFDALVGTVKDLFSELVRTSQEFADDLAIGVANMTDAGRLAYLVASTVPLPVATRQEILELPRVSVRLRRLCQLLQHELAVRKLMQRITTETAEEISKDQREHILRKHKESIEKELSALSPQQSDLSELRARAGKLALSEEARSEATHEFERLERTPEFSPEHGMIRTYLDWLLKLPWGEVTGERIDVARARRVLDADHYDLDRIKERVLDYLAVKRLRAERNGHGDGALQSDLPSGRLMAREPILCFLGPPGVGKTSLGQSIARALGRPFVHQTLGGVHDEAELRGHRRTYIGAMPGRILQALARAKTMDPVFMLDEIDKLGVGFHGDPSAALLEILDPAENRAFTDTYLSVPFDLSRVLFICTANTTDSIPPALLDRMEILTLAGYTEREKVQIAKKFLLPAQRVANGLREGEVMTTDDVIVTVIRRYTREAGVRNLERELGTILRKTARRIAEGARPPLFMRESELHDYLGPTRFYDEVTERLDRAGVAPGLCWTPSGGEVLFVEASMVPGSEERLILTGMLGNVMRESAEAALTYLRANADRLGIPSRALRDRRVVHVHVPAGAIPKDGPSAGVTILAALASCSLGRAVHAELAMTGELTLRGRVLPVGGIKEKVLAAHRLGLRTVVLPRRNAGELEDVPADVRRDCRFLLVDTADEVLKESLGVRPPDVAELPPPPIH